MIAAATAEVDGGPVRRLLGFLRLLRDNGFAGGLAEARDTLRLAEGIDLSNPHELRWGLRSLLCASRLDWERFDELFDAYWLGRGMKRATVVQGDRSGAGARRLPGAAGGGGLGPADHAQRGQGLPAAEGHGRRGGASQGESLAQVDLRFVNDPEELRRVYDLTERLAARMRHRLTRRERRRARGRRLDLRRVIHKSIPHGGTPLHLAFRRRWPKPLRLVVLLDASGSMTLYSGFFVRFLRGVLDHFREADAYVFHTRLVHVADALRERNTDKAVERMSLMASGWGGGTRIGESLASFNRHHAATALNSRSVVIIVSDGYDTGPPERLADELARLRRRARRIVWLNPMMGWRGYQPVAGGMAAALPHLDLLAPAHNLESLAALEPYLLKL